MLQRRNNPARYDQLSCLLFAFENRGANILDMHDNYAYTVTQIYQQVERLNIWFKIWPTSVRLYFSPNFLADHFWSARFRVHQDAIVWIISHWEASTLSVLMFCRWEEWRKDLMPGGCSQAICQTGTQFGEGAVRWCGRMRKYPKLALMPFFLFEGGIF